MEEIFVNGSNNSIISSFDDEPHILENIYIRAGLILLYFCIFLLCFFGNLAVILVVSLQWKRHSVSKFCLGNMAVANFSVSLFCILQNLTLYLLDSWIFGELMCKMYHFITNLCHTASIIILVSISIERYVVLLHPFRCRQILTKRSLILLILFVWLLSAGISLPRFYYFGLVRIQLNEDGDSGDICVPIKSMYNSATADTIYFLLLYLSPLAVLSAMYLRIGLFLRPSKRLRRELDEEAARVRITPSSENQLEADQIQLDDLRSLENRFIREVNSDPVHLGLVPIPSDASSPSMVFTFRGQVLPQPRSIKHVHCPSLKELDKLKKYPTHVLRFVSTTTHSDGFNCGCSTEGGTGRMENVAGSYVTRDKLLIRDRQRMYRVRRCDANGLVGDHPGSQYKTTSSSALQRRAAMVLNPEARRILYRYNRLQLSHIRCKQRQKVIRMLIFIVITFAVLNLPYHVRKLCLNYLPSFDMTSDANNLIAPLTFALMYANCAVNPILYAFMSKHFRNSLRGFFRKYCVGGR